MAITLVQSNQVSPAGTTLTATATLPSGVSLGNLLIVAFTEGSNNTTMTGPTGWTQAVVNKPAGTSATIAASIWYLKVAAGQVGQTSWLFTGSASHSMYLCAEEWNASMGWQASPLDVTAMGNTIATPVASTTISSGTTATTAQAEELWVAVLAYKATAATESSITAGWTKDTESTLASNNTSTLLYRVAAATGTAHCQYTIPSPFHWSGVTATFMPISVVTNTWNAVDDPLTVQDNDLTGDLDYATAISLTDSLSSTETNVETEVQLATDSLIVLDSDAIAGIDFSKVQLATDSLSVLDSDAIAGIDFTITQLATDSLSSTETNVETKVQTSTDSLSNTETNVETKVQTSTDSLSVSETASFVVMALIDQVIVSEAGQEGLAVTLADGTLAVAETNATSLAFAASDTLTPSEISALLLIVASSDALAAPTDSIAVAASTIILLPDVSLAPTDGLLVAKSVQSSDAPGTLEVLAWALLSTFTDTLTSADLFAFSLSTAINLTDSALVPSEVVATVLQSSTLDVLATSEVGTVAMAAVIIDIGVQPSENLARAFSVTGSDTLVPAETMALNDAVAASDVLGATEASLAVGESKGSDGVTTVEGVLEGIAAFFTENVTSLDLSSTTGGFTATDRSTASESTAASYGYVLVDSTLSSESTLLALAVFDQSQDAVSDALTYLAIVGPSSVTVVEQNAVVEVLLATAAMMPVDQVGTIDQSTTTTILAPVETLNVAETIAVFASPSMFLLDTLSVSETLLASAARTLGAESVASFESSAFVIGYAPVDSLSSLETIAAFAVMTMSATDSNTAADLLKSASLFGPIDLTPVGDGLAALPFALAVLLTESVVTSDLVRGLVLAPFTDSVTLSSERLVASSTLTFADSLIMTDAATEGLTLFPGDATLVVTDSMAYVRGNPLFVDTLVPSDGLILVLLSHPAPDTLLLGEQFTFSFQTVATALTRVRSGRITMTKRTGSMRSRARTGIAVMVVRVGTLPTRVRSSTLSENVR